ncbi:MAG TPA: hypothetical protein VFB92_17305 [Vicinamibacterales bacterium]|jgi:hypothetical protein|nr:hypothetical protein [Vicinamibacterales bacterium]
MRIVVFSIALVIIVLGVIGVVAPDTVMAIRRDYVAIPRGVYTVGALRVALGLLLIVVARASRMPRAMRVLGVLVCAQGLIQVVGMPFIGLDRARAILEWEAMLPRALLRAGALVALATGAFIAYAVRPPATRDSATGP